MVGYNAVFYALSYYEFPSTRITVGVRSKASLTSRTFSTTSTVQSSTGSNSSYEKGTNHISRQPNLENLEILDQLPTSKMPLANSEDSASAVVFT